MLSHMLLIRPDVCRNIQGSQGNTSHVYLTYNAVSGGFSNLTHNISDMGTQE